VCCLQVKADVAAQLQAALLALRTEGKARRDSHSSEVEELEEVRSSSQVSHPQP
jgi:hypothetical protein